MKRPAAAQRDAAPPSRSEPQELDELGRAVERIRDRLAGSERQRDAKLRADKRQQRVGGWRLATVERGKPEDRLAVLGGRKPDRDRVGQAERSSMLLALG